MLMFVDFDMYGLVWMSGGMNMIWIDGMSMDGVKFVINVQYLVYGYVLYEVDVMIGVLVFGVNIVNVGFIVYVMNLLVGIDVLMGYYIGFDVVCYVVQVGCEQNNWIDFIDYLVFVVVLGSMYYLKVVMCNNVIDVYVDGVQVISINDVMSGLMIVLCVGVFGLCCFGVSVVFSNVIVSCYLDVVLKIYDFLCVVGVVYNLWNVVNVIDFWQYYDLVIVDCEFDYVQMYGMNMIIVYLYYLNWVNDCDVFFVKFDSLFEIVVCYGLKVVLIFYDDCWYVDFVYGLQFVLIFGVYNSCWVQLFGQLVEQQYLQLIVVGVLIIYKQDLQYYIVDFVFVYCNDLCILYWELMNEFGCSGNGVLQLMCVLMMNDVCIVILNVGVMQLINLLNVQELEGDYFFDFYVFYLYVFNVMMFDYLLLLSLFDSLNLEMLQCGWLGGQVGQMMVGIVFIYGGKMGFFVWELMIGCMNMCFYWGQMVFVLVIVELVMLFQGMFYFDGYLWSMVEVQVFVSVFSLWLCVLNVMYYNDMMFMMLVFLLIMLLVDFDLNIECGIDLFDVLKGMNVMNYVICWIGVFDILKVDNYMFSVMSDNVVCVWIDGCKVIDKEQLGFVIVKGCIYLLQKWNVLICVEYVYVSGLVSMYL